MVLRTAVDDGVGSLTRTRVPRLFAALPPPITTPPKPPLLRRAYNCRSECDEGGPPDERRDDGGGTTAMMKGEWDGVDVEVAKGAAMADDGKMTTGWKTADDADITDDDE